LDEQAELLKEAIDHNDLARVQELMTRHPELHRAPMGYANNGPLTWAAECRVPWEPPGAGRLALVEWMIENGSDIHQGGDGPLMRAALNADRIPMMELLVSRGADVNAEWNGWFPIIFSPCESVDPDVLAWLLAHGAEPNCGRDGRKDSALDYLIATYARSADLPRCIDLLRQAGGETRYDLPGVLDTLRGDIESLHARLDAEPELIHRRYPELECGSTGARRLLLAGGTLLHVAAEFGQVAAAQLLLERGADVNAPADGFGQTPIFHAATQFGDYGVEVVRLLIQKGADLRLRVRLPGHYDRAEEFVACTPLEYAGQFPGGESETTALLRAWTGERG
jgi:ankyrin repeat protein